VSSSSRSHRSAVRHHRPLKTNENSRELVYDGQALVGLIRVASDGTAVVFDARGKTRGSYSTYDLARDALNRSPARKVGA